MRGEVTTHRDVIMLSEATWQASRGVRTPEWKFIRYLQSTIYGRDGVELYDLAADPDEQVNVADVYPEWWPRPGRPAQPLGLRPAGRSARPDALGDRRRAPGRGPAATTSWRGWPGPATTSTPASRSTAEPRGWVPGHVGAAVGADVATAADHLDQANGDGGRSNRGPRPRLRGARGVVVGRHAVAAVVLLGVAVNDCAAVGPAVGDRGRPAGHRRPSSTCPATGLDRVDPGPRRGTVHAGQVLASQDTTALTGQVGGRPGRPDHRPGHAPTGAVRLGRPQAQQVQTLKNQVTAAQLQASAAQEKLAQATATGDASVSAAQAQIRAEQSLLAADQQTYADEVPECVSATPPPTCGSDQRQIEVDQGNLTSAQNAETRPPPMSRRPSARPRTGSPRRTPPSARPRRPSPPAPSRPAPRGWRRCSPRSNRTRRPSPPTRPTWPSPCSPRRSTAWSPRSTGPSGEVATSPGVRQATATPSLAPASTTGIQLFPQGPQTTPTSAPSSASLITLDSVQDQMIVQVPETDIGQIHVGQRAKATLPAVPGSALSVTVSQIERTPVDQSGETYFRVDLVSTSKDANELAYHPDASGSPAPGSPMVGFTVDVAF